jgi:hypothetical protein
MPRIRHCAVTPDAHVAAYLPLYMFACLAIQSRGSESQ